MYENEKKDNQSKPHSHDIDPFEAQFFSVAREFTTF
jgi:hypothetical protein